jgi:hypothetical protein
MVFAVVVVIVNTSTSVCASAFGWAFGNNEKDGVEDAIEAKAEVDELAVDGAVDVVVVVVVDVIDDDDDDDDDG